MAKTERKIKSFAQAPRSILMARSLDFGEKVILIQLIDRYDYLKSKGKLNEDGSFYMVRDAFEEQNSATGKHITTRIIPKLIEKGFIQRSVQKVKGQKTYNFFVLNMDYIESFDREMIDEEAKKKKSIRGKKAVQAMLKNREKVKRTTTTTTTTTTTSTSQATYLYHKTQDDIIDLMKSYCALDSSQYDEKDTLWNQAMTLATILYAGDKDRAEDFLQSNLGVIKRNMARERSFN